MIRLATPDDGPALMRMGEAFHTESGYAAKFPFDMASFAHTCSVLGAAKLLLVADHGNVTVGMAGADIAPAISNHAVIVARETFWYVIPEYRKGLGLKLLRALETVVGEHGATFFDVVAEPGPRSAPLEHLYERRGFNPAEKTFRKDLRCHSAQLSAA